MFGATGPPNRKNSPPDDHGPRRLRGGVSTTSPRSVVGPLQAKRPRGTSHESLGRVVAQGDPLQGAEGITPARARAAAVISESMGIPSHLSLPPFDP
jgi:hypothetical protein